MAASFDGTNLIITLGAPTGGVLTVDAEVDLYSDWKEWFKTADNSKYPLAFRTVGGDTLTPGIDAGAYFFIRNDLGWRIRPYEADHTIYLTGNLTPEDSSLPILIPTIGNYRVLVDGLQPITQNIDTIKDTLEFSTFNGGIYWDAVNGKTSITDTGTDGNEANPLKNLSDVVTQAVAKSFTKIYVVADATVSATPSLDNYRIEGENRSKTVITFSGADTGDMSIEMAKFSGSMNGALFARDCTVGDITGVGCTTSATTFIKCGFDGNLTLRADNIKPINIIGCGSVENNQMVLDVNGTSGDITIQDYSDRIKIINMTSAINVHVSSSAGCELEIDASCTAVNLFEVHGNVNIINNSNLTIDDDSTHNLVWEHTKAVLIRKITQNRTETDPVTGVMTVYDDDGTTPLFTANIWENVGGTVPYSGNAVNRRDALS